MTRKTKKPFNKEASYLMQSEHLARSRRLRRIMRKINLALKILIVIAVIWVGVWAHQTGRIIEMKEAAIHLVLRFSLNLGLNLENIYIEGINYLDTEKIVDVLPAETGNFGDSTPILSISLEDLKSDIENIGWVQEANIERILPNTLLIRIIERKPYAIWQNKGQLVLIDIAGNIISYSDVGSFPNLPVVVGEDANLHVGTLFTFLSKEAELMKKVQSVVLVNGRRWNIRLNNGIEIKLPEENPDKSWRHIAELHRQKKLLDRQIKSIDMRIEDRLFIEVRSEGVANHE